MEGGGLLKAISDVHIDGVFDEHAIFYSKKMHDTYKIGDKVEIIPVHICPVCNLYDEAYLIKNGEVIKKIPVLCRGKLQ